MGLFYSLFNNPKNGPASSAGRRKQEDEVVIKMLNFFDCCWVLAAYIRGRIFRQEMYRPQKCQRPGPVNLNYMRGLPGSTHERALALQELWGFRPMKLTELAAVVDLHTLPKMSSAPRLQFNGAKGGLGLRFGKIFVLLLVRSG